MFPCSLTVTSWQHAHRSQIIRVICILLVLKKMVEIWSPVVGETWIMTIDATRAAGLCSGYPKSIQDLNSTRMCVNILVMSQTNPHRCGSMVEICLSLLLLIQAGCLDLRSPLKGHNYTRCVSKSIASCNAVLLLNWICLLVDVFM